MKNLLILLALLASQGPHLSFSLMAPSPPAVAKTNGLSTTLVSPDTSQITEQACIDTANRMQRLSVPVSTNIHPSGQVGISFAHWPAQKKSKAPPIFLIHGFDSSCLEYRRLGSRLAERGIDTYAVDLLGWGYTQLDGVTSFSANAKVEALSNFIATILGNDDKAPFCIAGASLGGAAAIEVAAAQCDKNCQGLVLLDAQGFVDGIGPMAKMPKPLAQVGVQVLKSVPLRSSANQMSYFDKETFATDEAVVVGRLHCLRDGWSEALVSFMQSGGFAPSTKVPTITAPSLVLWGRQDGILDGTEFANKFVETLGGETQLQWIEECGHVPHLEKPDETADAIAAFVQERVTSPSATPDGSRSNTQFLAATGLAGATALAALASDWIPFH